MEHWFVGLILNRNFNPWKARFENDKRMCPRIPPAVQASQIDSAVDKIDETSDFVIDLPSPIPTTIEAQETLILDRCDDDALKREQFDEHQIKHPCLWSSLSLLRFNWSDNAIFALYRSHPQWFDSTSGTSLLAAAYLLRLRGFYISIARPGETPSICWSLKDQRGHFEITKTHDHPPQDEHECLIIHQQAWSGNLWDEMSKKKKTRTGTANSSRQWLFGSMKNKTQGRNKEKVTIANRIPLLEITITGWAISYSVSMTFLWSLLRSG